MENYCKHNGGFKDGYCVLCNISILDIINRQRDLIEKLQKEVENYKNNENIPTQEPVLNKSYLNEDLYKYRDAMIRHTFISTGHLKGCAREKNSTCDCGYQFLINKI